MALITATLGPTISIAATRPSGPNACSRGFTLSASTSNYGQRDLRDISFQGVGDARVLGGQLLGGLGESQRPVAAVLGENPGQVVHRRGAAHPRARIDLDRLFDRGDGPIELSRSGVAPAEPELGPGQPRVGLPLWAVTGRLCSWPEGPRCETMRLWPRHFGSNVSGIRPRLGGMFGHTALRLSGQPRCFVIQQPCRSLMTSTARERSDGSRWEWTWPGVCWVVATATTRPPPAP